MDDLARKRHIRGPYNVARFVTERTGLERSGSVFSSYFYDEAWPSKVVLRAFGDAFELNEAERRRLAMAALWDVDIEE
jgi:hypothetical protein